MKKRNPKPLTGRDREDARDVAFIRRTVKAIRSGQQKTYTHAQVMRGLGFYDLATPVRKRR